jgi:hypothetical protein
VPLFTGVRRRGFSENFASKILYKGALPRPDSPLRALSRGPGAVVRRQARKTLHKAVNRRIW